jgi:hypothetical protein
MNQAESTTETTPLSSGATKTMKPQPQPGITPTKQQSKLEVSPSVESSSSKSKIALTLDSPNRKGQNSQETPSKPPLTPTSQDVRLLNLNLEYILQVTLRVEAVDPMTTYLGDLLDCKGDMLTADNFSEVVCAKLSGRSDFLNAVSFLVGSYKRLSMKETASSGNFRTSLAM